MIKATKNQLANINNGYQGKSKKVLCVCSAGLLRSPTMANVIFSKYGHNTRSCGAAKEYALIPISEALIRWADEIVLSSIDVAKYLNSDEKKLSSGKTIILNIGDNYDWNEDHLVNKILEQYGDTQ